MVERRRSILFRVHGSRPQPDRCQSGLEKDPYTWRRVKTRMSLGVVTRHLSVLRSKTSLISSLFLALLHHSSHHNRHNWRSPLCYIPVVYTFPLAYPKLLPTQASQTKRRRCDGTRPLAGQHERREHGANAIALSSNPPALSPPFLSSPSSSFERKAPSWTSNNSKHNMPSSSCHNFAIPIATCHHSHPT